MERKQVIYDLRTTYSGPFSVEDFYASVDNWIYGKGFVKETKKKLEHITKDGKKIRINNADVFVNVDGFIQTHMHGTFWQIKPIFYFIRSLIDQYIWNFWSFKWDSSVNEDGHDLFKTIWQFFEQERQKYL